MNSSDIPSRINKAFGLNGLKNTIPIESNSTTDNGGIATFDKGFPPITMQPLSAGGIPPSGKDMNGVLYSATIQQQWQNAGMSYPFSQDFSDAVSGYPKGAIVPSSAYTGQWLNLNEANGTPPESATGASTGWVPVNNYGITQITMTSGSVVMSSIQAAKDRIIITGTLTANVNLIFPAWIKSWVIHNNTTGNFTINCKTVSGPGVLLQRGIKQYVYCDGISIYSDLGSAAYRDVGNSGFGSDMADIPDMNKFPNSYGDNGIGWLKLPGGDIIQMGAGSVSGGISGTRISMPIPFSKSGYSISICYRNSSQSTNTPIFMAEFHDKSTFDVYVNQSSGTFGFFWTVMGK